MDDSMKQLIKEAGWVFPESVWICLSDDEKRFVIHEFTGNRSFDYYVRRLEAIGFKGMERVLDAACGMGQWAMALSALNQFVEGVDINIGRLLVSKSLAESMVRTNCAFRYAFLESLPFDPESFDAIFCYGTFMFTHMPMTLYEFSRILKPGGKLYLNANTIGWYAHLLIDRGFKNKDFSIVRNVFGIITRTFAGKKRNIIVSKRWLQKQIEISGLEIISMGLEGEITIRNHLEKPEPAYPQKLYGMPTIIEVLAKKRMMKDMFGYETGKKHSYLCFCRSLRP